uniref:PRO2492 n=1 Tax=Homo sapiens TaxID=9606 RepID=Q9P165_HUMAN|nr:PRO2492 [Homo sapiens]
MCYHIQLIFKFFVETGLAVSQAGLELLDSSEPPTTAFQSAGITGMSYCTQTINKNFKSHIIFWKHLVKTYYMPDIVLKTTHMTVNKTIMFRDEK